MNAVITSPRISSLEAELVALAGGVTARDGLVPLTVVVGWNLQHTYMRRRLARAYGAIANVRFLPLLDLAGEVRLAMPDDPALRPLTDTCSSSFELPIRPSQTRTCDFPVCATSVGWPHTTTKWWARS